MKCEPSVTVYIYKLPLPIFFLSRSSEHKFFMKECIINDYSRDAVGLTLLVCFKKDIIMLCRPTKTLPIDLATTNMQKGKVN